MFYNCLHVLVLDITAYTFFLPYNYYQVYLYCLFQSAVTCLIWPFQQSSFVFGQADGKVKLGGAKGSKSQTLYAHDSYVVSLASRLVSLSLSPQNTNLTIVYSPIILPRCVSPSGKGVLGGHADGAIVRYTFEGEPGDLARVSL